MKEIKKAFVGGILATAVMSALILTAPYLGFPRMPVWEILANAFGIPVLAGWIIHFLIGILLAGIYILFFKKRLPGNYALKGMIFSLFPFFLAQIFSLFSGKISLILTLGSLIGHLVYGFVLGLTTK